MLNTEEGIYPSGYHFFFLTLPPHFIWGFFFSETLPPLAIFFFLVHAIALCFNIDVTILMILVDKQIKRIKEDIDPTYRRGPREPETDMPGKSQRYEVRLPASRM